MTCWRCHYIKCVCERAPITLLPVAPTSTYVTRAFVTRRNACSFENMHCYNYPPSPTGERLRVERVEARLNLRDLALLLGLRASDVSDLERGRQTLSEQDWGVVFADVRQSETSGRKTRKR